MSVTTVYVSTVSQTDYQQNADKFYRAYAAGDWCIFQFGARGTVGQWRAKQHGSPQAARAAAVEQIGAKIRKGYGDRVEGEFQFDVSLLDGGKPRCIQLDDVRQAANVSNPVPAPAAPTGNEIWDPAPTTPTPAPWSTGVHAEFTARALKAITLAVTDPEKGAVEFALLNAAWPELEAEHAKAQSYLNTLDSLVMGVRA